MANFAKAQLLKYGWTEGKGLGKNENGITEALKPKLKFNSEGVGYKPSEEVHWWQSAFNNAAKNVLITSENDEVSISVIDRNTTLRNLKAKQSRQEQYNNFRKLNVLQDEKLITLEKTNQEKEEEKESIKKIPILTDEELFKACGGRTLHKGARHGVGMNGKLERVANQEKKLMHLMNHLARKRAAKARLEMEEIFAKSGHKVDSNNANATLTAADVSSSKENGFIKSKATIKKEKKNIQHLTRLLTISCNINDNSSSSSSSHALKSEKSSCRKRKRSKDRRAKVDHGITNDNIFETITSGKVYDIPLPANSLLEKKNKKHKRHHKQNIVKESSSSGSYKESRCCDSKHNSSLKSKTKKSKHQEDSDINIKSPHGSAVKKLKYHNRKIIKLMERMSFDNSNDEHKKNEEDNSNANVTKSQHVFCNHEASRLNLRILKKKKHRLHKKNKEKLNLERRITSIQSQDKLSCIAENLMAINITEDVSAKLKRCKQGKEENKIEKTNDNEDRTCI
ncbi:G patch domain-containing protein 4 [Vespula maculifrons]|uniref:G patch domain-containing protein 4 n=1 Tax=Vespula maculifrons TaxID=7453 RepID=A0ABD2B187_VESMC|nr:G patch domain-containing protein 4 [Vespula vulgaris]